MGRKEDLENLIRKNNEIILDYENIRNDSDNPKERSRASRAIEEQNKLIKERLDEYSSVCSRLGLEIPNDIQEVAAKFLEISKGSTDENLESNGKDTNGVPNGNTETRKKRRILRFSNLTESQEKILIVAIPAVLGVIGTIVAAYFSYLGDVAPLQANVTAIIGVNTNTAQSTSTITATQTVSSISTLTPMPVTEATTSEIINDKNYKENVSLLPTSECLETSIWVLFLNTNLIPVQDQDCWELNKFGIFPDINGEDLGLKLFFTNNDNPYQDFQLVYRDIPSDYDKLNFELLIFAQSSSNSDQYSDIIVGLGNSIDWMNKGHFLFFRIPEQYITYNNKIGADTSTPISHFDLSIPQSEKPVQIVFSINTSTLEISVDNEDPIILRINDPREVDGLWIGYGLPLNGSVNAFIKEINEE